MSQLEISFEDNVRPSQLRYLAHGKLFQVVDASKPTILMKVKPVNFLCNSALLSDVFARGDCLVVGVAKGTTYIMRGDTAIIELTGSLKVRRAE